MADIYPPTVKVQVESVDKMSIDRLTSSPPRKFLVICVNVANEIAHAPGKVTLVITGDFIASVKARLNKTVAAESFDLVRGEGIVGGKTICHGDEYSVLLHEAFFERALDFEENPDAAFVVLKTLVHEMNHVSMYQRGESSISAEYDSWKDANLFSAASAIIDEYRAELGALKRLPIDEPEWDPSKTCAWLEDTLLEIVVNYQLHLDVRRLVFDVGAQMLVALKQMAYTVAFEKASGKEISYDVRELRYPNAKENLPLWIQEFREILFALPSGETLLSSESEHAARQKLGYLLDKFVRHFGFEWDEPMFLIRKDFLALIEDYRPMQ